MLESLPTEAWSPSPSSVPSAPCSSVPASLEFCREGVGLGAVDGFSVCGDPRGDETFECRGEDVSSGSRCPISDRGSEREEVADDACIVRDKVEEGEEGTLEFSREMEGEDDEEEVSVTDEGVEELELPGEGMEYVGKTGKYGFTFAG
jgi:hypothetical protein